METTLDLSGLADSAEASAPDDASAPGAEAFSPESLISQGIVPEGYTRDRDSGEIRPKKRRGRPKLDAAPHPDKPIERGADVAPDSKSKGKRSKPVPRYQKGVIAAGMTKLYQRAGRIIRVMDRDIGIAVIESAADCGEAWEDLARTNPRIRRALLKAMSGGAWGALIMAHAPILLAVIMKDGIRKHIPLMRFLSAALEDDDRGAPSDIAEMLGGLRPEDVQQMMTFAQSMMPNLAARANGSDDG